MVIVNDWQRNQIRQEYSSYLRDIHLQDAACGILVV